VHVFNDVAPVASLYVPAGQSLHNSILYNPSASLQQRKQTITATQVHMNACRRYVKKICVEDMSHIE
jgi:hypothetical protein